MSVSNSAGEPGASGSTLSVIAPALVEGEPRILDTDLAKRLGFAEPLMIRKLIKRHEANLLKLGVLSRVEKTSGSKGGAPAKETYLNKKQAIFLTAKSETAEATAITIEIIERFDAYEHEKAAPRAPATLVEALHLALNQQLQIEAQQARIEHMEPKVEGFDQIANSTGRFQITVAAALLDIPRGKFVERLHAMRWIYKLQVDGKPQGGWIAHADKLRMGLLLHKSYSFTGEDGEERTRHQVFVTPKGLTKLAILLGATITDAQRSMPI